MYTHTHTPTTTTRSPQEDVINLSPDVRSEPQELPVDPVQDGLQEVPLPGVLAVKQLQDTQHEGLVNVPLGHKGGLEVGRLKESQEERIHQLQRGKGR